MEELRVNKLAVNRNIGLPSNDDRQDDRSRVNRGLRQLEALTLTRVIRRLLSMRPIVYRSACLFLATL